MSSFWNPRDHRYGETASSPGSIPRPLCPANPPNAPPPSISIVLPCGETTKRESPCPTSRTLTSSFPADDVGENGKSAISKEHETKPPLSTDVVLRCHGCTTRKAAASSSAKVKNATTTQRCGPGIR